MRRRSRGGSPRRGEAVNGPSRSFAKRPPQPTAGPSEIAILDCDGRIVAVNQAWRESLTTFGLALRGGGVGVWYVDVACQFLRDLDRDGLERSLQRLLSGAVGDLTHSFTIQTTAGPRRRQVQITPMQVGGPGRFVAIHDDQTELATTREALKVTSEQLLAARDEERQRIAIELHDSTSQHLAAMGMSLTRLRRLSPRNAQETELFDEIAALLGEAVKETRVISYLMKPRGLGQEGLAATVEQFLEGFARRTGLDVALETDGAVDDVPAPLQHAALRIVQEALMNVNRHAQARRVSVGLAVDDGLLRVSVVDDGRGMRRDADGVCLGVGIPGMHARTQQFSGELAISSDETGTRVVALLPLR